jgi:hypothetical protein
VFSHTKEGGLMKYGKLVGLFLVMLIVLAVVSSLDNPGVSFWHYVMVTIAVFIAERLYVIFVLGKN